MILGDLGASVIKVENPNGGDESRRFGPPFIGSDAAYFVSVNRNKRSIAVDLKAEDGRAIVSRLATMSDIVIENLSPVLPTSWALDMRTCLRTMLGWSMRQSADSGGRGRTVRSQATTPSHRR